VGTGGALADVVLGLDGEGTEPVFDLLDSIAFAFALPLPLSILSELADFLSCLLGAGVSRYRVSNSRYLQSHSLNSDHQTAQIHPYPRDLIPRKSRRHLESRRRGSRQCSSLCRP
jgi:hypothetical protein